MLSAEYRGIFGRLGLAPRGLGPRVLVGTAAAVIGVSAVFLIASWASPPLVVAVITTGAIPVPFGAGVFSTAASGGAANVLARLAGRASRPRRMFLLVTTAGLVVSAVPPLAAATTVATAVWLLVMHVVAALALIPVVASGLPSARPVDGPPVSPPASTLTPGSAAVKGHR